METNFLGPSQQMGQQLQGILQSAASAASDRRAEMEQVRLEKQQIAKNFEIKSNLAHALMATDPDAALTMMNDGLQGFGVNLTMEQFRPAMKGFEVMADLARTGDHQGAAGVLKSMKAQGWLVNLQDQARAAQLERESTASVASQQASAIQNLQAEPPQLARSRELLNMAGMVGGDLSRVHPDEVVRLTGSTDPTEQEQALRVASTIVDGHDTHRQHLATLFSLDPGSFGKAADATALSQANPEILAKGRIADLLQRPDRTEQEERELHAKGSVYTPHLAEALGLKSAAREREQLVSQLEDARSRSTALTEHLTVMREADERTSTLRLSRNAPPPQAGVFHRTEAEGGGISSRDMITVQVEELGPNPVAIPSKDAFVLSDAQAKQHLLAEGTREAEGRAFLAHAEPRIQSLEQTAKEADGQRERLSRLAVSALPEQKARAVTQIKELESMSLANRAMARLLKDENPYAIAAKESALALLDDPKQLADETAALDNLKTQRERDLKAVEDEQARLARREAILQSRLPAAERKEEQERKLRMAHQAVDEAVMKGLPLAKAVREAGEQFGVDKAALAKNVMEARGSGLWEAQNAFAVLPAARQTPQEAGKIASQYGVSAKDVLEGIKNPNKPLVEVSTYDRKQNVQEAGQLANVNQSISELQQVRKVFINEDGSINRAQLAAGAWAVPFTKGRGATEFVEKSVEIKLRAATGAAARQDEIKFYKRLFGPSVLDSDEIVRYKLDSFENWMQTVAETTDPEGALRSRAELLLSKGTIQLLTTPEYKELRAKFPQASTSEIVRFLQSRKVK